MKTRLLSALSIFFIVGCHNIAAREESLYVALGGQVGLERLVDQLIEEIHFDPVVMSHFEDTNWDRFREKQLEHLCLLTGGECQYTGDSMLDVHAGMNVSEAAFNALVNDLQKAMEKLQIPVGTGNRLLAILASMRSEIIYL